MNRKIAIIVGVLFIIGTVAGVLSVAFAGPVLDDPGYLMKVSANENQITTGAIFVLIMGFALAMVPVMIFPVLKKYNEALALGYVVFRGGLEAVTYIATAVSWLLLIALSQEYVQAGAPDASYFQAVGTLLRRADDLPYLVFAFPLGALMFYSVLYQSKLIPRWLSVWGFVAVILNLAAGLLQMFGLSSSSSYLDTMLNLPIFLQEMVMAVWLIVKGFNASTVISGVVQAEAGG
jgi:hypothetical protein